MKTSRIKTFSELQNFRSFRERYEYLRLGGVVGETTFGLDRYLNQAIYRSRRWSRIRDDVIVRDNGCDLGLVDFPIRSRVVVHHMNVITMDDILTENPVIYDPEFLICVSVDTHLAIHYGDISLLPKLPIKRKSGDTCLWHRQ